jgi:hypothetical protein
MMEVIETVRQAVREEGGVLLCMWHDGQRFCPRETRSSIFGHRYCICEAVAKAAILASLEGIREPTEVMVEAWLGEHAPGLRAGYAAMIDALRAEIEAGN